MKPKRDSAHLTSKENPKQVILHGKKVDTHA